MRAPLAKRLSGALLMSCDSLGLRPGPAPLAVGLQASHKAP